MSKLTLSPTHAVDRNSKSSLDVYSKDILTGEVVNRYKNLESLLELQRFLIFDKKLNQFCQSSVITRIILINVVEINSMENVCFRHLFVSLDLIITKMILKSP